MKISTVVRTYLHMSKGVFMLNARPLIRQTCFPAVRVLLTSEYFEVSKECVLGNVSE